MDDASRDSSRPGQIADEAILLADLGETCEMIDALMRLQRSDLLHGYVSVGPNQSAATHHNTLQVIRFTTESNVVVVAVLCRGVIAGLFVVLLCRSC